MVMYELECGGFWGIIMDVVEVLVFKVKEMGELEV